METPRTILMVDDDVDLLAASSAALEAAGYRVVTAEDAESGFTAAASEQPALIVLDLMMEEADSGVRLARRLRREPATQAIPIVILTGVRKATGFDFQPMTQDDFAWIAADAWVEKPIAVRQLVGLVAGLLEAGRSQEGEAR
jgi:CheY-like chemotaxis protein